LRELLGARNELRDARHNPQRHFKDLPQELLSRREQLLARGAALAGSRRARRAAGRMGEAAELQERVERRRVHHELAAIRDELFSRAGDEPARLRERVEEAERRLLAARTAGDRECFFGLLSFDALRTIADRLWRETGAA
jgi:hypothetical protein